jgi:hypothetical protein
MINIKNSELTNEAVQALNTLIDMDIKASVAFKLLRIIKEVSSLVEDKLKIERRILDKWIMKDEDNNNLSVFDDDSKIVEGAVRIKDMYKFQEELQDLLNTSVSINGDKINFEDLCLETIKIKDFIKIDFIFE